MDSPNPINGERFGGAIAIDGDTAVIGASGAKQGSALVTGRAFVYLRIANKWELQATLSYDASQVGDAFGHSVAIRRDIIVIGAPHPFLDGSGRTGRVLIYKRPESGWRTTNKPHAVLLPYGGGSEDSFGSEVAISFNRGTADPWIIVSASQDDRTAPDAGVVYVFRAVNKSISLKQIIEQPNPVWNENFGNSLAIDEDYFMVGAPSLPHSQPGAVFTYQLSADGVWEYQQTIVGPDTEKGDHFGRSLGLWRDDQKRNGWLVIGATGDDDYSEHSGSAYIYKWVQRGGEWEWQFWGKYTDPEGGGGDHLGFASTVIDGIMAIGAPFPGINHNNKLHVLQYQPTSQAWTIQWLRETVDPDPNYLSYTGAVIRLYTDGQGVISGMMAGMPQRDSNGKIDTGGVLILSY